MVIKKDIFNCETIRLCISDNIEVDLLRKPKKYNHLSFFTRSNNQYCDCLNLNPFINAFRLIGLILSASADGKVLDCGTNAKIHDRPPDARLALRGIKPLRSRSLKKKQDDVYLRLHRKQNIR